MVRTGSVCTVTRDGELLSGDHGAVEQAVVTDHRIANTHVSRVTCHVTPLMVFRTTFFMGLRDCFCYPE